MILYHGTTYNRYQEIVNKGSILTTSDNLSHYPSKGKAKTTRGYVYLTTSPLAALEFANKCWKNDNFGNGLSARFLTIFEINVPDNEVEYDLEEYEWNSSSVKDVEFYRIKR